MVSLVDEVRELVVASLRLQSRPSQLAADTNLFGPGLGLDSVDTVQLVVSIEAHFGVTFSDAELAARPLTSIEAFVQLLTQKGVRGEP
jgi:acyl carrier protein